MTQKQKEISFGTGLVVVIVFLLFLFGSGRISDEPAPDQLSFEEAKAYCEMNGWKLPTSDKLKKSGKIGWTLNPAPKENNMILPDRTQHECILQAEQNAQFCPDSQKLPVYCVK